jgi:hypothetical protein
VIVAMKWVARVNGLLSSAKERVYDWNLPLASIYPHQSAICTVVVVALQDCLDCRMFADCTSLNTFGVTRDLFH